jgi:hypothetical protein
MLPDASFPAVSALEITILPINDIRDGEIMGFAPHRGKL